MKPTTDTKEKFSNLLQKTAEVGKKTAEKTVDLSKKTAEKTADLSKKVADSVQQSAKAISEKNKDEAYLSKMKKYNPLFPAEYFSASFTRPNMIVIVDDAVRKGIDVCEGAIGWLSNSDGMEVLNLYDEAILDAGIQFVPAAICDTVYYVDNFDRNRYIQIDKFFSKAHEEKLAELEQIAYMLGAKTCSIELEEAQFEDQSKAHKQNALISSKLFAKVSEQTESSASHTSKIRRSGRKVSTFQGHDTPKLPELKWFAHDDNIKGLIHMRCSDPSSIKSTTLELEGSASSAMSLKTACAADGAIKAINAKSSISLEQSAKQDSFNKLIFVVEF